MRDYQIAAFSDVAGNVTFELWEASMPSPSMKVDTITLRPDRFMSSLDMAQALYQRFNGLVPQGRIQQAIGEAQQRAFMNSVRYTANGTITGSFPAFTEKPLPDTPLVIEAQQDCECPVCHETFTLVSVGKKHLKERHGITEDVAEEWAKSRLREPLSEPEPEKPKTDAWSEEMTRRTMDEWERQKYRRMVRQAQSDPHAGWQVNQYGWLEKE